MLKIISSSSKSSTATGGRGFSWCTKWEYKIVQRDNQAEEVGSSCALDTERGKILKEEQLTNSTPSTFRPQIHDLHFGI